MEAAVRGKPTHTKKKVATMLSKYVPERLKMVLENKERRIKRPILMYQGKKTVVG